MLVSLSHIHGLHGDELIVTRINLGLKIVDSAICSGDVLGVVTSEKIKIKIKIKINIKINSLLV